MKRYKEGEVIKIKGIHPSLREIKVGLVGAGALIKRLKDTWETICILDNYRWCESKLILQGELHGSLEDLSASQELIYQHILTIKKEWKVIKSALLKFPEEYEELYDIIDVELEDINIRGTYKNGTYITNLLAIALRWCDPDIGKHKQEKEHTESSYI